MPERAARLLLAGLGTLLLASCALLMYLRAAENRFDFHHFSLEAQYVWKHRALNPDLEHPDPDRRRQLPFYLPAVPVLIAWLGPLDRPTAAAAWVMIQMSALLGTYLLLRGWARRTLAGLEPGQANASGSAGRCLPPAPGAFPRLSARTIPLVSALLCAGAILEAAKFNQLSFPVLFLIVAGVSALASRPWLGGALLGFAAVLKLLPALFLAWLALKRQWRAFGAAVSAAMVVAVVPPLMLFGPTRTWEYHRDWWRYNVQPAVGAHPSAGKFAVHFSDHRNQSLAAVMSRLRGAQPESLSPLSPAARPGLVVALLLLAGLLFKLRRPWDASREPPYVEAAVVILAMLTLSPLVRTYYLVWAWPAVLLALSGWAGAVPPTSSRCAAVLACWIFGMLGWAFPAVRSYGVHLWMLIAMAVLLLSCPRDWRPYRPVASAPPA